jgi:EAL domain-containing protein (putative c-di-GMP-specific phosphodiesterase class I)
MQTAPFETAAHWLPLAMRSRLTVPRGRTRAGARARRHRTRRPGARRQHLARLAARQRLRGAPAHAAARRAAAARLLWIEVDESAAVDHFDVVRELARQLRPTGARFGLEHAGERLSRIDRLFEAGLDYVKLDASVAHGVADDTQRAAFVKGLATMLHSLSLQVIAEGVISDADAQMLWACGVDGLTGPWVKTPASPTAA